MWRSDNAMARALLSGAAMRRISLPALSLLSLLIATPTVHAARPAAPIVTSVAATHLEIEIAELARDGTRRATTLTLTLPDRRERGGHSSAELKTRVQSGERGEVSYYQAKLELEDTPVGTRYDLKLWRSGTGELNNADLRLEVGRLLKPAAPQQIGRVARPDGSTLVVTATLR